MKEKAINVKDIVVHTIEDAEEKYHLKDKASAAVVVLADKLHDGVDLIKDQWSHLTHHDDLHAESSDNVKEIAGHHIDLGRESPDAAKAKEDNTRPKDPSKLTGDANSGLDFKRTNRFKDSDESAATESAANKISDEVNSKLFKGKTEKQQKFEKASLIPVPESPKSTEQPVQGTIVKDNSVIIAHGLAEKNIELWKHRVVLSSLIATGLGGGVGFAAYKYGKLAMKHASLAGAAVFGLVIATKTIPAYIDLNRMRADLTVADLRK